MVNIDYYYNDQLNQPLYQSVSQTIIRSKSNTNKMVKINVNSKSLWGLSDGSQLSLAQRGRYKAW
jgi:hypothetical protein